MSDAFADLMRDLAHDEPNCGCSRSNLKLTNAQAATVLLRYPDLLGEALVGAEATIARLMSTIDAKNVPTDLLMMGMAAEVANRIRDMAPRWIMSDVQDACDAAELERQLERSYA